MHSVLPTLAAICRAESLVMLTSKRFAPFSTSNSNGPELEHAAAKWIGLSNSVSATLTSGDYSSNFASTSLFGLIQAK